MDYLTREELVKKTEELTRAEHVLATLCSDFKTFFLVDFNRKKLITVKKHPHMDFITEPEKDTTDFDYYEEKMKHFYEHGVEKEFGRDFLEHLSVKGMEKKLEKVPQYVYRFSTVPTQGVQHHMEVVISRVEDMQDSAVLGFRLIDDIIEQERLKNEELTRALERAEQAGLAKTQFLNNMSHDIRTPLNGILGMLEIIKKSQDDPVRVQECLDKIESSSRLLLSLINDVLEMAKLETTSVILNNESVNLDQVCDEVTRPVVYQAEANGIHVTGEHDDYRDVYVWTSGLHLKKVLMNLFSNSIKYNKPGGSISTSMKTLQRTEDIIVVEFRIRDTGIGMSEDFIKNKLFAPFEQADNSSRSRYTGTGLGMSIVKELLDKMGGRITVHSRLGEGSEFIINMPFRLDHQSRSAKDETTDTDISGMHFLLAEDNELNMEIAEFILKESGAEVVPVKNGQEALEQFAASEAGEFDAILMDVMMPVMDGLAATKAIRALPREDAKNIPILAMTANAFAEDARACLAAGMNAHLAKPLEMDKVKAAIRSCVKAARAVSKEGEAE